MAQNPSINTMIEQCSGLLGTNDLSKKDATFIDSIYDQLSDQGDLFHASDKQELWLKDIWNRNFA